MTEEAADAATFETLRAFLVARCKRDGRPSARELLDEACSALGFGMRFAFVAAVNACCRSKELSGADRDYFTAMTHDRSAKEAVRGEAGPDEKVASTVDTLLRASSVYRSSRDFADLIAFMGKFKQYSPYNNMLVRLQQPHCQFFATAKDWERRHGRRLRDGARPLIILAPMSPVLLVYEAAETEGRPLPAHLEAFAQPLPGSWEGKWQANLEENARRHRLHIGLRTLPKTNGGYVHRPGQSSTWKMRIVLNAERDVTGRFRTLVHEVAHVLLGHLGSDDDRWWPDRRNLSQQAVEIEAEATAYIVASRLGLHTPSAEYLAGYVGKDGVVPGSVSMDNVAKVAGRIEEMVRRKVAAPRPKPPRKKKAAKT